MRSELDSKPRFVGTRIGVEDSKPMFVGTRIGVEATGKMLNFHRFFTKELCIISVFL